MTRNPGQPRNSFTADTTMAEAMAQDANLPVVLMRFHMGGCSMCGFEASDSIRQVAEDNGVPLDRLLDALNGAAPTPVGPGSPQSPTG
jgi:hypothetical protein